MMPADTSCKMKRPHIACTDRTRYDTCGWNTDVEAQRIGRIRAGLPAIPKGQTEDTKEDQR